jgi:formylglycine-generating enzyme required for sulfatase activity
LNGPAWRLQAQDAPLSAVTLSLCDTGLGARDEKQQQAAGDPPLAQRAAGQVFKDCADCPEMVVVPAGFFLMGSPAREEGRTTDEGPQHKVSIPRPLAIGRTEVTRAQFARFVADTGHKSDGGCYAWGATKQEFAKRADANWNNPGFAQGDDHPVVCVSWDDTKLYTQWLAKKTGKNYRLLSEAEWEYAARAGTETARYWGETFDPEGCKYANVADSSAKKALGKNWSYANCDDGQAYTAPVRSYEANKFGLYDMIGNAWEWTEDCWHDSYSGAPDNGEAWSKSDCGRRVLRGGSWYCDPDGARAANRGWYDPGYRNFNVGFRLARTD